MDTKFVFPHPNTLTRFALILVFDYLRIVASYQLWQSSSAIMTIGYGYHPLSAEMSNSSETRSLNMPPKRKPEMVTQEEVALTQSLADDEGHTTAGRTYLGDIAIHVDHLETDTYRNRERDEDHNARLVQTFTVRARGFHRETRLKSLLHTK